ncbi:MAG: DUF4185 domain-containing protein [Verrucomicrobia bacterium]|nr:DUF4185 domain-containing protein [Verrucomicrobiota bacterium]
MNRRRVLAALCGALALSVGPSRVTAAPPEPAIASAVPWPEADALFRQDPRWLGADCAYSVDLGGGRVLWLFGDTFVATSEAHTRRASKMPRNTVAIQEGYDPSTAKMQFYWNTREGAPASFFPDEANVWYWPGGGVRLANRLLIFLLKVRRTGDGMFGFAVTDTTAVAIENPDAPPDRWELTWLVVPQNEFKVMVGGASVLRIGDHLYAFGSDEGGSTHTGFLARWPLAALRPRIWPAPDWWDAGTSQWIPQRTLTGPPAPLLTATQTEFSVHYAPRLRQYLQVQTRGFGGADLVFRSAPEITGPWSAPKKFHRPAESDLPGVLVYAGKAHPELTGADLVVTYATNTDWERCLDDPRLYYPRFIKVTFATGAPATPTTP